MTHVMKSIAEVERMIDELEKLSLEDQVAAFKAINHGPNAHIVLTSGRFKNWALSKAHLTLPE